MGNETVHALRGIFVWYKRAEFRKPFYGFSGFWEKSTMFEYFRLLGPTNFGEIYGKLIGVKVKTLLKINSANGRYVIEKIGFMQSC